MYIQKVVIKNVKSIDEFVMNFDEPAGWHVLIGDNGSGKSSVLRSIALAIIGPENAQALRLPFNEWIKKGENSAEIRLTIQDVHIIESIKNASVKILQPTIKILSDPNSKLSSAKLQRIDDFTNVDDHFIKSDTHRIIFSYKTKI